MQIWLSLSDNVVGARNDPGGEERRHAANKACADDNKAVEL